jgi:hypothetical protein
MKVFIGVGDKNEPFVNKISNDRWGFLALCWK